MTAIPNTSAFKGMCPRCAALGIFGQPCAGQICARQGIHLIPYEKACEVSARPPARQEPLIGMFVGDFLIIDGLGNGRFGPVLLGLQCPLFRLEAVVKLLEVEVVEAFAAEARTLIALEHPHVVRSLQYGGFQGRAFLATVFVPGSRTLRSEITRVAFEHHGRGEASISRAGFDTAAVARLILTQVLDALEAAHTHDVIHRDIRPENILLQDALDAPWHVKVVDFGLAHVVALGREGRTVTSRDADPGLGVWTDLHSVGVIAFELMTGRRPFAGHDVCEHLGDLALPAGVLDFLRKALAPRPEDGFHSAREMRDALGPVFDAMDGGLPQDWRALLDDEEVAQIRHERDALRQMLELEKKALQSEIYHSLGRLRLPANSPYRSPAPARYAAGLRQGELPSVNLRIGAQAAAAESRRARRHVARSGSGEAHVSAESAARAGVVGHMSAFQTDASRSSIVSEGWGRWLVAAGVLVGVGIAVSWC